MAEWSKALVSGISLFGGGGSNPPPISLYLHVRLIYPASTFCTSSSLWLLYLEVLFNVLCSFHIWNWRALRRLCGLIGQGVWLRIMRLRVQIPSEMDSFYICCVYSSQLLINKEKQKNKTYTLRDASPSLWPNWTRRLTTNQEIKGSNPFRDA